MESTISLYTSPSAERGSTIELACTLFDSLADATKQNAENQIEVTEFSIALKRTRHGRKEHYDACGACGPSVLPSHSFFLFKFVCFAGKTTSSQPVFLPSPSTLLPQCPQLASTADDGASDINKKQAAAIDACLADDSIVARNVRIDASRVR